MTKLSNLSHEDKSKLLAHLMSENYIDDECVFTTFIDSISERYFRQLCDDMTYVMEPFEPVIPVVID